uniref:VP n=1 Tax=Phylloscopus inornatus parvoviridae sp. TaxID=2794539 RepID=A0A8A4XE17_9VIRU|nr:MAG: VP [Phylloscopus inornatus parvoviridae sp.]
MGKGVLFPGYNYLGPGNSLDNGEPVNKVDKVARDHDIAYSRARSKQDIFNSDWKAIKSFGSEFIKSPSIAAASGAVGLGIKTGVERSINKTIYPNNLPGMPKDHNVRLTLQEGTQRKPFYSYKYKKDRQKVGDIPLPKDPEDLPGSPSYSPEASPEPESTASEAVEPMENEDLANSFGSAPSSDGTSPRNPRSVAAGSRGGTSAGAATSGMRGTVELYRGVKQPAHTSFRTYKKQYRLRIINEDIQIKSATSGNKTSLYIRYPYHDIPVNALGFYLSGSEIRELQNYTFVKVKKGKCIAHNKTAVLTFETSSSTSNIGNNNIGIYMNVIDKKINNVRSGQLPDETIMLHEKFWGQPTVKSTSSWSNNVGNILGAQYVVQNFSNLFEYETPVMEKSSNNKDPWYDNNEMRIPYFDINPFIEKRFNASFNEGVFDVWEWDFDEHIFSLNEVNNFDNLMGTGQATELWSHETMPVHAFEVADHVPLSTTGRANINSTFVGSAAPGSLAVDSLSRFRNPEVGAAYPIHDRARNNNRGLPPSWVFGIEPLYTHKGNKNEIVPCFVDIILDVELTIELSMGCDYINQQKPTWWTPNYKHPKLTMSSTATVTNGAATNTHRGQYSVGNEILIHDTRQYIAKIGNKSMRPQDDQYTKNSFTSKTHRDKRAASNALRDELVKASVDIERPITRAWLNDRLKDVDTRIPSEISKAEIEKVTKYTKAQKAVLEDRMGTARR